MSSLRCLNGPRRLLQSPRTNYHHISHLRLTTIPRRPFSLFVTLRSQTAAAYRFKPQESTSSSTESQSSKRQAPPITPVATKPKPPEDFDILQHNLLQNSTPYDVLSTAHKGWRNARRPGITDHSLNDSTTGLIRDQSSYQSRDQPSYPIWPQNESGETAVSPSPEQSSMDTVNNSDVWSNTVRDMDKNRRLSARFGCFLSVDGAKEANVSIRLRQLGALASANRIPYTAARQRFHERPGLKRKRLRRERWRRRFKDTFKSICKRVTHLTKQGW
jgi:hypothetical protein